MGGCALPVQAEGGIQSATVHLDERLDGAEGIAAGDHGKDGEQQKMGQLVELAFRRRGSGISLSAVRN